MKIPRRTLTRVVVLSLVVLLALTLVVSASAGGPVAPTGSMHRSGCSIYYTATVTVDSGPIYIYLHDHGNTCGDVYINDQFTVPGPGTYTVSGKFRLGSKYSGERFDLAANYLYCGWQWVTLDTITYSCPPGAEIPTWYFSVQGMDSTTSYSYNGIPACGVFDVLGHGIKTVDLLDYPNCEGNVMVMCLDGEGNWTDTNVVDFTQVGTVVQWTSTQHGTCAFFPAP
jgi:hypothetical protein